MNKPKTVQEFYDSPKVWEEYFDEGVMYNAIPYASFLGDDIEFPDIKIATHETFVFPHVGNWGLWYEYETLKSIWFKDIPVAIWYTKDNQEDELVSEIYVTNLEVHKEMVEYIRSLLPTREPWEMDDETFTKLMGLYDEEA